MKASAPVAAEQRGGLTDHSAAASLVLALGIASLAMLAPMSDALGWTALALAGSVIAVVGWRVPQVRTPLLAGFALRAFASLLETYAFRLPGSGADTVVFEGLGYVWSLDGWRALPGHLLSGAYLFSWVIALLYLIGERSEFMVQVLNVLLGSLVVYNVFLIARLIWDERVARRAAWAAACFPTMVLFSAVMLREVWVTYPLTLAAVCFLKWRHTNAIAWLACSLLCAAGAVTFHSGGAGIFVVIVAAAVIRSARATKQGQGDLAIKLFAGLGLALAFGLVLFVNNWGRLNYLEVLTNGDYLAGYQGGDRQDSRTNYLTSLVMRSPADAVWQLPIRLMFFQFMPFPWFVRATVDLVGLLDSALYGVLFWGCWRGRKAIRASADAMAIASLWFAYILVFSLVVSNYGTGIRHRGKAVPLLIPVAIIGWSAPRNRLAVPKT